MITRVQIDPNIRVENNWTFAGEEDVLGPIIEGADVEVFEPEADLVGVGRIERYDPEYGLVYLSVDWPSIRLARGNSNE